MLYAIAMVLIYWVVYAVLLHLFSYFFNLKAYSNKGGVFKSLVFISVVFLLFFAISEVVTDRDLGNRILHSLAGGFTATLLCFFAMRDSCTNITRLQFAIFTFLIVMSLGVANEITEFAGQNLGLYVFSTSINDTWLDLVSNTVGAIVGCVALTPFVKSRV